MSKESYEKIMAGLKDALAHASGDKTRGITHKIPTINKNDLCKKEISENKHFKSSAIVERVVVRDAKNGQFIPVKEAQQRKSTAIVQKIKVPAPKPKK